MTLKNVDDNDEENQVHLVEGEIHQGAEESRQESDDDLLPNAFYCPITKEVMREAVVHPKDCNSYEKSAVLKRDGQDLAYYPNRALQAYIEQELARSESSEGESHQLPDALYCPITHEIIFDPVISPDGTTYERFAITQWLQVNGVAPNTGDSLRLDQLYDNNTLLALFLEESEDGNHGKSVHPAMKKWREDFATQPSRFPAPEMTLQSHVPTPQTGESEMQSEVDEKWRRRLRPLLNFLLMLSILAALAMLYFFPAYAVLLFFVAFALFWVRRTQVMERQNAKERERNLEHRQENMERQAIEESLFTT